MIATLVFIYSVIPKPGPKEYVIPLIKTNKWRVPSNSKDISSVKNDTTEADINELAAKAILNGTGIILDFLMYWNDRYCNW